MTDETFNQNLKGLLIATGVVRALLADSEFQEKLVAWGAKDKETGEHLTGLASDMLTLCSDIDIVHVANATP